jgi:hypothetical protein
MKCLNWKKTAWKIEEKIESWLRLFKPSPVILKKYAAASFCIFLFKANIYWSALYKVMPVCFGQHTYRFTLHSVLRVIKFFPLTTCFKLYITPFWWINIFMQKNIKNLFHIYYTVCMGNVLKNTLIKWNCFRFFQYSI